MSKVNMSCVKCKDEREYPVTDFSMSTVQGRPYGTVVCKSCGETMSRWFGVEPKIQEPREKKPSAFGSLQGTPGNKQPEKEKRETSYGSAMRAEEEKRREENK